MPKIKNIIIFIIIAIVFILIYIFFVKPSPEQANLVSGGEGVSLPNIDGSTTNTNTSLNSLITKDFLVLFSNIKNIKLDDAILSDIAFNSLNDSSIILIPDGNEGRINPFAKFGNDPIVPSVSGPGIAAPSLVPGGINSTTSNIGAGAPKL